MYNEKAFDDAVAWLYGSGSLFTERKYSECSAWLVERGFGIQESRRATCGAAKRLGMHLEHDGFRPYEWVEFREGQISIGDTVHGGRTVYNEYAGISGVVTGFDKWRCGERIVTDVEIEWMEDGKRGTETIDLGSIYRVDKKTVAQKDDYVNCWECGSEVHISKATYDGNGWYCGC